MGKYKRCENANNTGGNMTLQMLHDKYFIFSRKDLWFTYKIVLHSNE